MQFKFVYTAQFIWILMIVSKNKKQLNLIILNLWLSMTVVDVNIIVIYQVRGFRV